MHLYLVPNGSIHRSHKRAAQENSYLLNGRYRGYANEVGIAQTRQDISVPVGRWVGQTQRGIERRVTQTGNRLVQAGTAVAQVPGNILSSVTGGIFSFFG